MLAQNFKTPAELGKTADEFDALVKVLGMLEREECEFVPGDFYENRHKPLPKVGFSMSVVFETKHCGTVGCIVGWARHFGGKYVFACPRDEQNREWQNWMQLIAPPNWREGKYTAAQSAIALRNYLTHGQPNWAEALEAGS